MINIITRFSRKNRFIEKCLPSVQNQTNKDYHHIITYENEENRKYLEERVNTEKTTLCKVFPTRKIKGLSRSFYYKQHHVFDDMDVLDYKLWTKEEKVTPFPNWEGGRYKFNHFPYNLYLIRAEKKVKDGWVMYLDDDDEFYNETSIERIINELVDEDCLYFIRAKYDNEIIPKDIVLDHVIRLNQPPALGVGFNSSTVIFHSKYLEYTAWDEWSGADWKTIQSLFYTIPKRKLIDEIVVKINGSGGGEVDI